MNTLQDTIGLALVQLMRAHRNRAEAALHDLGVHVGQEMLLMHLWREDGVPQSQLVETMCVEPPTITKMIQRMERAGLVERRQDEHDARISRVYLTEHGRSLQQPVVQAWAELEQHMLQGLSDNDLVVMRRLLARMHANIVE